MFVNYNFFISVALGIVLYFAGRKIRSAVETGYVKAIIGIVFFLLCIPALSFAIYYVHLFETPLWYYEFRSVNNIEILSGLCGLFAGFMETDKIYKKRVQRTFFRKKYLRMSMLLICLPFIKPVLTPGGIFFDLKNQWKEGVCLQSTPSTCGPCSLVTILKYYGVTVSEKEAARASYTSLTGTEIWYIARYAEKKGFSSEYMKKKSLAEVPVPSIIGVKTKDYGHFVALLEVNEKAYVLGDPLYGRLVLTKKEFNKLYDFTGFAIHFSR